MSNVEGMYSIYFIKRVSEAKPPFDILRLDILLFCGSLFRPVSGFRMPGCQFLKPKSVFHGNK